MEANGGRADCTRRVEAFGWLMWPRSRWPSVRLASSPCCAGSMLEVPLCLLSCLLVPTPVSYTCTSSSVYQVSLLPGVRGMMQSCMWGHRHCMPEQAKNHATATQATERAGQSASIPDCCPGEWRLMAEIAHGPLGRSAAESAAPPAQPGLGSGRAHPWRQPPAPSPPDHTLALILEGSADTQRGPIAAAGADLAVTKAL